MRAQVANRMGVKTLQRCIACLSKFSLDFYIVALHDHLDLLVVNDRDTVVVLVTLQNPFFEFYAAEYTGDDKENDDNPKHPIFAGKLLVKPVFNSLRLEKELKSSSDTSETLTIKTGKDDRIYFDFDRSLVGVQKKFAFSYEDISPPWNPREFVRTTYYNQFSLPSKAFLDMVEIIPTDVIYGTLSMKQNAFSILSSGTEVEGRSLETKVEVDLGDFIGYSVQEEYDICFNLRDLRKALEFAASIAAEKDVIVTNAGPGTSLIIKFHPLEHIDIEFVLATSADLNWVPKTTLRNQNENDTFQDTQSEFQKQDDEDEEIVSSSPERDDADNPTNPKRSLFGELRKNQ